MTILTHKEEAFCVNRVKGLTLNDSYKLAYKPVTTNENSINRSAAKVAVKSHIVARIKELRDKASEIAQYGRAEFIADLKAIVQNDANEFSSLMHVNCRWCNGKAHKYQWRDANEFADEVRRVEIENERRAAARKKVAPLPLPSDPGGYGFKEYADPKPTCPRCYGEGRERERFKDTRKLSKTGRMMYQGIKKTKEGIEIKTVEKSVALQLLGKAFLGPDNQTTVNVGPTAGQTVINPNPVPVDPRDAAKFYQSMMQGKK